MSNSNVKMSDEQFCKSLGWFPAQSIDLTTGRYCWHMTGKSEPRHINFDYYPTRDEAASAGRIALQGETVNG